MNLMTVCPISTLMFVSPVDQDPAGLSRPLGHLSSATKQPLPVAAGSAEVAQRVPE